MASLAVRSKRPTIRILDLPPEVRLKIYAESFDELIVYWTLCEGIGLQFKYKTQALPRSKPENSISRSPPISVLKTCKTFWHEATPILYDRVVFDIEARYRGKRSEHYPYRHLTDPNVLSMLKNVKNLRMSLWLPPKDNAEAMSALANRVADLFAAISGGTSLRSLDFNVYPEIRNEYSIRAAQLRLLFDGLQYVGEFYVHIWGVVEDTEEKEQLHAIKANHAGLQLILEHPGQE